MNQQRDLFEINSDLIIDPAINGNIAKRRPLFIKNKFDFIDDPTPQFIGGPQRRSGLKLAVWTWFALVTDVLVIMSFGCLLNLVFMLSVQYFLKSDLGFIFNQSNRFLTMSTVFVFTGWMYFIATRALVGASIGEWSCSLRLGQPSERLKNNYITKLVFRTTIQLITGIFIIPILSFICRKDIAGKLSGLSVYSLK